MVFNSFVSQLIQLQQDGKGAISGPRNWREPPLLEVKTPSDHDCDQLVDALVAPHERLGADARWHWLVGSPGNGKSARLGRLARRLRDRHLSVVTPDGIDVLAGTEDPLPYMLEVRATGMRFPIAYLVQDASVVRDPFAEECDPARDLAETLADAWARGISMIVCTNWGVLQRLLDLGMKEVEVRNSPWFAAVRAANDRASNSVKIHVAPGRRTLADCIDVTFEYLDNRSLLLRSTDFDALLIEATRAEHWSACTGCPSAFRCPFLANRDDIADADYRQGVLRVLRRAEVMSGQVIVFREAVALVSLLLSGCPNDYRAAGSPCEWVHERSSEENVFALLARRVPALLFGSWAPMGLEPEDNVIGRASARSRQVETLNTLLSEVAHQPLVRSALDSALVQRLSFDVGVARLLGPQGVLAQLDPALDPLNSRAVDHEAARLLDSATSAPRGPTPGLRSLELECVSIWNILSDAAESAQTSPHGVGSYFWLRRWQCRCLGWTCALMTGTTATREELDDYIATVAAHVQGGEGVRRRATLEKALADLLSSKMDGAFSVPLASSMWLRGEWAKRALRPRLAAPGESVGAPTALKVRMSDGALVGTHNAIDVELYAPAYVWLSRRGGGGGGGAPGSSR
jgi:hypothetical protein